MFLAVLITPKQASLILGVTGVISSWVNSPQQELEKLKCNTFGELDRSAISLPTPFNSLIPQEAHGAKSKERAEEKK